MKWFALMLATAVLSMLLACTSDESASKPTRNDESTVPWNRPASWEGGLPGMNTGGMPGRY